AAAATRTAMAPSGRAAPSCPAESLGSDRACPARIYARTETTRATIPAMAPIVLRPSPLARDLEVVEFRASPRPGRPGYQSSGRQLPGPHHRGAPRPHLEQERARGLWLGCVERRYGPVVSVGRPEQVAVVGRIPIEHDWNRMGEAVTLERLELPRLLL